MWEDFGVYFCHKNLCIYLLWIESRFVICFDGLKMVFCLHYIFWFNGNSQCVWKQFWKCFSTDKKIKRYWKSFVFSFLFKELWISQKYCNEENSLTRSCYFRTDYNLRRRVVFNFLSVIFGFGNKFCLKFVSKAFAKFSLWLLKYLK